MNFIKSFSKKNIIIFSLLVCAAATLLWDINWDDSPFSGFDMLLVHIVVAILTLVVIKILGLWDTIRFTKRNLGKGFILGIPFLVLGILSVIVSNLDTDLSTLDFLGIPTLLLFTANMFMVGVGEELVLRGVVLNNMLSKWGNSYKGTLKAVFASAIIFGAIHLTNLVAAPPVTVLVQSINAAAAGILFAAIYIRSRNILSAIIIHALSDWLSLFLSICFSGATSIIQVNMTILQGLFIIAAGSLPPILIGLFLLRKGKLSAIE